MPQTSNFQLPRQADAYQAPTPPPAAQPQPTVQPAQPATPASPYDFITANEKPTPQFSLPGGSSLLSRALIFGGGLVGLIILAIIFKSLLGGGSKPTALVSVAQDQQELIHLATAAGLQQGITTTDQNFAATTQLAISSAQSTLITYLATNGQKVAPKVLSLKVSAALDTQLQNAAAATTYDQTFQQIMKNQLTVYSSDMQQAFQQTKGPKGRALLNSNFNQAKLLLLQLNAPGQ